MYDEGIDVFRYRLKRAEERGHPTQAAGYRRLLTTVVGPLSEAIRSFFEDARSGRPGPRHTAVLLVGDMDPDEIAYLTARHVLDGLASGPQPLAPVANAICTALEVEASVARFEAAHPSLWRWWERRFRETTSNEIHKRRAISVAMFREGIEPTRWTAGERVIVGAKLVELLIDATGMVRLDTARKMVRGVPKTTTMLALEPAAASWVTDYNRRVEGLAPAARPCVIPPKPWTGLRSGGYWTERLQRAGLVKFSNRAEHGRLLTAEADLSRVTGALNAVQETPWRVNRPVLEVAKAIWDGGLDIPILPPRDDPPVPAKPEDIETNEEARRVWRREAHDVYRLRSELVTQRRSVAECLRIAEDYAEREAMYFPHNLDFRGRLYALPRWLQPQGDDLAKGLLTFAEGKPLGTEAAANWLAVHTANTWGEDKVPFDARRAWVDGHREAIQAVAADPLANRWWTGADSPWSFLAACHEWSGYLREGLAFRSSLPIALDGSCNGLQHYSAMLRDPVGGRAVNLVPSDRPQDVYGEVAKVVEERLLDVATRPLHECVEEETTRSWAHAFLDFGIDRKITKRSVMVLPYGGTITSCRDYVRDAVREKIAAGASLDVPEEEWSAAVGWLGSLVWASIGQVVVAARVGMSWLQAAARVAGKADIPLTWAAPSGFLVYQRYAAHHDRRVKTRIHGQIVRPLVREDTGEIAKLRQASAIAPNFVHSLDAAALTLTVLRAKAAGIASFAMVHDSYGTHAADTDTLARELRAAFVGMYTDHDPLAEFRERLLGQLPEDLRKEVPELPPQGTLDLSEVLSSPFFFA